MELNKSGLASFKEHFYAGLHSFGVHSGLMYCHGNVLKCLVFPQMDVFLKIQGPYRLLQFLVMCGEDERQSDMINDCEAAQTINLPLYRH